MTATAFISTESLNAFLSESATGSDKYFKVNKIESETRVRFLGSAITGWEAWTVDNKPLRWDMKPSELPENCKVDERTGSIAPARQFLASVIYNHDAKQFQIWEITQVTISRSVLKYVADEDWGDPQKYDFKVDRKKNGDRVEYTLSPCPKKKLPEAVTKEWAEIKDKVKLTNMFEGTDPWA